MYEDEDGQEVCRYMGGHDFGSDVRPFEEPLGVDVLVDAAISGFDVNRGVAARLRAHLNNDTILCGDFELELCWHSNECHSAGKDNS
jgi:hypothetical protein